jgi:hypothetical protein
MTLPNYDTPRRRVRRLYRPISEPTILQRKLRKEFPSQPSKRFAAHFEKLEAIAADQSLVGENVEPPSQMIIDRARAILHKLEAENLEPTRVVASVEGGVGVCFVDGEKYADIECLNAGEILGVVSNRRDRPTIWKIDPSAAGFEEAARRIRDFFTGMPTSNAAEQQAG